MSSKNYTEEAKISGDTPVPKRSILQRLLAIGIIAALIVGGFLTVRFLVTNKPVAKKRPPQKMKTLVEASPVIASDVKVMINGYGTVKPARKLNLSPRVSGRVEWVNPSLKPGGTLKKGEVLAVIDDTDYKLEVQKAEIALRKAQADLEIEMGRQKIAQEEWELLKEETGPAERSPLALREPQLKQAKAAVENAEADLAKAKLNLSRTRVNVPFNAVVLEESTEVGSQVSASTAVASLAGTDEFWAEVSIPLDRLDWFDIPDAHVNIRLTGTNTKANYEGRIVKLLSELESDGLMARLLIAVEDPMGLDSGRPPLLAGSHIKAEIEGRELVNSVKIPRRLVVDNSKVYIAMPDNTLDIRELDIIWKDPEWVYARNTFDEGERIITSRVASPVHGMPLMFEGESTQAPQKKGKGRENAE
ncbi:efflux RND transporter periplasmic adaptor subunit [Limisalsivibrio acetivorans]|uniref:efflux RND transporter periplasmic adaptor subunit n=1 Tax=Limisalsivibrio acetivorans TaxID=1304888 RepID=UPI0003B64BA4|nr:efflux RND transporter periplasmic adaptor subunit [Limisalsivibrio acetivorans]